MKLKNGKIGNINKKLLAGALALVFTATSFVGCATISDIDYTTNEQGYVDGLSSKISYTKYIEKCSFIKVKNNIINDEYYTIGIRLFTDDLLDICCFDLFTRQNLSLGDFELEYVDDVNEYLVAYNMVKDEYTEEELREVLNLFIENQEKDNTKQKVKE